MACGMERAFKRYSSGQATHFGLFRTSGACYVAFAAGDHKGNSALFTSLANRRARHHFTSTSKDARLSNNHCVFISICRLRSCQHRIQVNKGSRAAARSTKINYARALRPLPRPRLDRNAALVAFVFDCILNQDLKQLVLGLDFFFELLNLMLDAVAALVLASLSETCEIQITGSTYCSWGHLRGRPGHRRAWWREERVRRWRSWMILEGAGDRRKSGQGGCWRAGVRWLIAPRPRCGRHSRGVRSLGGVWTRVWRHDAVRLRVPGGRRVGRRRIRRAIGRRRGIRGLRDGRWQA